MGVIDMLGLVIIVLSFVIAVTGFVHTHTDDETKSTVLGITRTGALLIGCATGCLVAGAYQEYDKMKKSQHRDALLKSTHDEIIRISQQMPDQDLEAKLTDIAASIDKLKSNDSSLAATLSAMIDGFKNEGRSTPQKVNSSREERPTEREKPAPEAKRRENESAREEPPEAISPEVESSAEEVEARSREAGDEPIQVGGDVTPPVRISSPAPQYTVLARKARVQGVLIARATINRSGHVEDVEVLRGLPMGLNEEAIKAFKQWTFEPATLDGEPVTVYYTLTANFKLQ